MAANHLDTAKPAAAPADQRSDVDFDEREDNGLPGRPMALLLAVGLALLAALIAWVAVGGFGTFSGR